MKKQGGLRVISKQLFSKASRCTALFLGFSFFSFISIATLTAKNTHFEQENKETEALEGINILKETSKAFTSFAKKAIPAVVFIKTQNHIGISENNLFNQESFYRFFGNPRTSQAQQQPVMQGTGSGFFVSSDGYVVTNNHVVKDAERITVTLQDGREYEAGIVGLDPNTEVAVIKVEGTNFPFLELGNSDEIEIGEWVVAIGNPFEFRASLTVGVVSATGRGNLNITKWDDFIQTDADINPGNSGGPLLNLNSEVIGINTAIFTNKGIPMGIGFAIPVNIVKHIKNQLIENGQITHGFLGIALQPLTPDLAQAFNIEEHHGAVVVEVAPHSPAQDAGLQQGDIIVKYDNTSIQSLISFSSSVALMDPGTPMHLTVNRDGKNQHIRVVIGQHPKEATQENAGEIANKLGFFVEDLSEEYAQQLGYSSREKGALVTKVANKSPGVQAGILPGSLILAINRKNISDIKEFYDALKHNPTNQRVLLLVKYGKVTRFVSINLN